MILVVLVNGGTEVKVEGAPYELSNLLGVRGMGFKFNRNKKTWIGPASLKNLQKLGNISGVILAPEAVALIDDFKKAAEKRAKYMASRKG